MATIAQPTNVHTPATSARILVVDDEPDLRTLYELTLLREGYQVQTAGTLAEAWAQLKLQQFDAVITDMRLPDGLGLEILSHLSTTERRERCIVMTAYGSAENAVESLKAGAFDYLTKPVDLKQFRAVVASAIQGPAAHKVAQAVRTSAKSNGSAGNPNPAALSRLVGESEPMLAVKTRIAKVARSMAPVLVRGESGTGKELVAQAIHGCSHRASGPFVAVNCGAIPENLLEAEFFGAKKGSYTGATQDREGYFQAARNGTLFLDEIGDLPLAMQSKLLRAIQERSIRAIGSTVEDTVDVRIVSATHKDLSADVQAGRFRQDLYYRLNVIEIAVPPLRQRRSDLPALCATLLEKIARDSGMNAPALSQHLLNQLEAHPLRGNVRELENLLHRALALNDGSELDIAVDYDTLGADQSTDKPGTDAGPLSLESASQALSPLLTAPLPPPLGSERRVRLAIPDDLQAYLDAQEKAILTQVLQETQFNRTAAAARLKLSLRQIRYRIASLNITMPITEASDTNDESMAHESADDGR
jgi:two-component system response regulator PilR (NtrC family)